MGLFGRKRVTEESIARVVTVGCLELVERSLPDRIAKLRDSRAAGLVDLAGSLQLPGSALKVGIVVLGLENRALQNLFEAQQAARLRRLVSSAARQACLKIGSTLDPEAILNAVDDSFRLAIERRLNIAESIGEVLAKELDLKLMTLGNLTSSNSLLCGPVEHMTLGIMCVDLAPGAWKKATREFKITPGPERPETQQPVRYSDEPAALQRKVVEVLLPLWIAGSPPSTRSALLTLLAEDRDELPEASGEFGFSPTNPVLANGPQGEIVYLERLLAPSGARILYHRLGVAKVSPIDGLSVDAYEVFAVDGSRRDLLFFLMHSARRSRVAPRGYSLRSWDEMSDSDRLVSKIGAHGVNDRVEPFPSNLPQAVFDKLRRLEVPLSSAHAIRQSLEAVVSGLVPGRSTLS